MNPPHRANSHTKGSLGFRSDFAFGVRKKERFTGPIQDLPGAAQPLIHRPISYEIINTVEYPVHKKSEIGEARPGAASTRQSPTIFLVGLFLDALDLIDLTH